MFYWKKIWLIKLYLIQLDGNTKNKTRDNYKMIDGYQLTLDFIIWFLINVILWKRYPSSIPTRLNLKFKRLDFFL